MVGGDVEEVDHDIELILQVEVHWGVCVKRDAAIFVKLQSLDKALQGAFSASMVGKWWLLETSSGVALHAQFAAARRRAPS